MFNNNQLSYLPTNKVRHIIEDLIEPLVSVEQFQKYVPSPQLKIEELNEILKYAQVQVENAHCCLYTPRGISCEILKIHSNQEVLIHLPYSNIKVIKSLTILDGELEKQITDPKNISLYCTLEDYCTLKLQVKPPFRTFDLVRIEYAVHSTPNEVIIIEIIEKAKSLIQNLCR